MSRWKAGLATCTTGHRDIHDGLLLLSRNGLWAGCRLRVVCGQVEAGLATCTTGHRDI